MSPFEELTECRVKALRQERPELYYGTKEEVISFALCVIMANEKLEIPLTFYQPKADDYMSLAFVERVCKEGFDAVINDGELIAFKKAV